MNVPVNISRNWKPAQVEGLPSVFTGGFVGYAGYDTVRYVYGGEPEARLHCAAGCHISTCHEHGIMDDTTERPAVNLPEPATLACMAPVLLSRQQTAAVAKLSGLMMLCLFDSAAIRPKHFLRGVLPSSW